MAPSSSAPFGSSSKSPRSPSDRTSARPGASSWSTSYSRTSSTRTERSYDDEDEEGCEEDLTYGNKQAVPGPSSSAHNPRLARPVASPLAPAPRPGEMARWQAPPPNNTMAPYPYDNRIQSAPIVGQNQALYQNTYAPAPNISNRDTGNTNTSQVTDAYNDKSRHRVEVTNMTIHNHYHAPQSAPPTYPSSPPISASASGSSAPSAYPSAPRESRRRSRSRGREVEYFPLQSDIPIHESAPSMQREPSGSSSVPYPNYRQTSGRKASRVDDPVGKPKSSGRDKRKEDSMPPPWSSDNSPPDFARPEKHPAHYHRGGSVDLINSGVMSLSANKGKNKQSDDAEYGLQESQSPANNSGRVKRYSEAIEEAKPPPPPPKDADSSHVLPRLRVAIEPAQVTSSDSSLLEPFGYPSLIPCKDKRGYRWPLRSDIEDHIAAYMGLNLFDTKEVFPLWDPRPLETLPNGEQRPLNVGDLVHLGESGEVHVVFNILRSFDQNVRDGLSPPPKSVYSHLQAGAPPLKIRVSHVQDEKYYSSDGIVRLLHEETKWSYHFKSVKGVQTGGIIVLPHGAEEKSLASVFFDSQSVKKHFWRYAPTWYQHVRTENPRLRNGSLFIVTRAYLARTWGVAALATKKATKDEIPLKFCQKGPNPYVYGWDRTDNRWKVNSGPSNTEVEGLRQGPPAVNCVGIVVHSLVLDNVTWSVHFERKSQPSPSAEQDISSGTSGTKSDTADSSPSQKTNGSPWRSKLSLRSWGTRKSNSGQGEKDQENISIERQPIEEKDYHDYTLLIRTEE